MVCTIKGAALPADVQFQMTNCSSPVLSALAADSMTVRSVVCTPLQSGINVSVTYKVPGYIGVLPVIPSATAMPPTAVQVGTLEDDFSGIALDAQKWVSTHATNPALNKSVSAVGGGKLDIGCYGSVSTENISKLRGRRIVVEAMMAGPGSIRDTAIALIDSSSAARIQVGDTSYGMDFGYIPRPGLGGLYSSASGVFGLPQSGNSLTTSQMRYYRLTLDGYDLKLERGASSGAISEVVNRRMSASIEGRTFTLMLGTGGPIHCPASFDWVKAVASP